MSFIAMGGEINGGKFPSLKITKFWLKYVKFHAAKNWKSFTDLIKVFLHFFNLLKHQFSINFHENFRRAFHLPKEKFTLEHKMIFFCGVLEGKKKAFHRSFTSRRKESEDIAKLWESWKENFRYKNILDFFVVFILFKIPSTKLFSQFLFTQSSIIFGFGKHTEPFTSIIFPKMLSKNW